MGWFEKKLLEIVEWKNPNPEDVLVHKFYSKENDIKYGAKLIVRQGQVAVFANEGAIADVFFEGTHTLKTSNLPVLSKLRGWAHGFESAFKSEVYFVSVNQFTDMGWGTESPIPYRDKEFGAVQLRAFGNYSFKVTDTITFLRELVGTSTSFTLEKIENHLRSIIVSKATDAIAETQIAVIDMASQYDEIGHKVLVKIMTDIEVGYGIQITNFLIKNIKLPDNVMEMLDKRSSMNILGDMQEFAQFNSANAIETMANKENSPVSDTMNAGMNMAMGIGMANQMMQTQANIHAAPSTGSAPPPPPPQLQVHAMINGAQVGPIDMNTIKQYIANGQLTPSTMVWKAGLANWVQASQLPEVASYFGATPPPPPPAG